MRNRPNRPTNDDLLTQLKTTRIRLLEELNRDPPHHFEYSNKIFRLWWELRKMAHAIENGGSNRSLVQHLNAQAILKDAEELLPSIAHSKSGI